MDLRGGEIVSPFDPREKDDDDSASESFLDPF
jgi:hypothetical protein